MASFRNFSISQKSKRAPKKIFETSWSLDLKSTREAFPKHFEQILTILMRFEKLVAMYGIAL